MNITERCDKFNILFRELQCTSSRTEKETIVSYFKQENPELQEDLTYIFETLAGQHPIGWTFRAKIDSTNTIPHFKTIKECIQACERLQPKSLVNTSSLEQYLNMVGFMLEDIMNRTLKLGIGKSLLSKSNITPMLAKKYDGQILRDDVFVTEKLDGNRCIAHYDGNKWCFTSRSGKPMNVDFDMTGMDTGLIYDGEVMSEQQTKLSITRCDVIAQDLPLTEFGYDTKKSQLLFNQTSGAINRHGPKSGLVYNVFDIISDLHYYERRALLSSVHTDHATNVRIIPVLYTGTDRTVVNALLDKVIQMGGEGVMLNLHNRGYDHKRTDALLKYKQVQFMDMRVINVAEGTGKYEGMVGSLNCYVRRDDNTEIFCDVGTGLSDAQREQWAVDSALIIGKIVQVGYHELTQDRGYVGTNVYSLRFPRLVSVRYDKDITSEY